MAGQDLYAQQQDAYSQQKDESQRQNNLRAISQKLQLNPTHADWSPQERSVINDIFTSLYPKQDPESITPDQWKHIQADAGWRLQNRPVATGITPTTSTTTPAHTLGVQATLGTDINALMSWFFPTPTAGGMESLDAQILAGPTKSPHDYAVAAEQDAMTQGQTANAFYQNLELPAQAAAEQSYFPATYASTLLSSLGYLTRYGNVPTANSTMPDYVKQLLSAVQGGSSALGGSSAAIQSLLAAPTTPTTSTTK